MTISALANSLLVDIGNQRVKWCFLAANSYADMQGLRQAVAKNCGAFALNGDAVFETAGLAFPEQISTPEKVAVSLVARAEVCDRLERYCIERWNIVPMYLRPQTAAIGLSNHYRNPAQLGCDRWFAALAGYRWLCFEDAEETAIIIDAGTAVTIDLVHKHRFEGGAILPGLATAIKTLANTTAKIKIDTANLLETANHGTITATLTPQSGEAQVINIVGKDSDSAVLAGALMSVIGGIKWSLQYLNGMFGDSIPVLLCGGDAALIARNLSIQPLIERNLVLAGLALAVAEVSA